MHPHDPADEPTTVPAPDQTDRLLLSVAEEEGGLGRGGDVLVLDDATGALVAAALDHASQGDGGSVIVHSTSRRRALEIAAQHPADHAAGRLRIGGVRAPDGTDASEDLGQLLQGCTPALALMRLPKGLRALDLRARELAAHAGGGELVLVAGGRVKHMSRSQNEVLEHVFDEVHATRGLAKSRGLVARSARPGANGQALAEGSTAMSVRGRRTTVPVRGIGGVFGGAGADAGSRLLLEAVDAALTTGGRALEGDVPAVAVDLGCGNGLLTAYLALALPEALVIGSDDDLDAVRSTRATLDAAGIAVRGPEDDVRPDAGPSDAGTPQDGPEGPTAAPRTARVRVDWDDSLSQVPGASVDLVLLNPPFHDGTAIDATMIQDLLDASARVLRPGGALWMVHNSHLRYRGEVESRIGPTDQVARDRRFTVLRAQRS